jgi:hypothetical protein
LSVEGIGLDVIAALKASFESRGMNSQAFNRLPASPNRIMPPAAYHMINSPLTIPLKLNPCANGIFQSFR